MKGVAVRIVLLVAAVASATAVFDAQRATSASGSDGGVRFEDVTKAAGLDFTHTNGASADKHLPETMGSGAVFFDYDQDGWIDLFVVDGGSIADPAVRSRARHRLFHNTGRGRFEDATAGSGIRHRDYGMGACAGDVDRDGRIDLYVTNVGPNVLYRNAGKGAFVDVTTAARVGWSGWSTSCAFLDVERDGDLDLFVLNYLDAPAGRNPFCGDPARRIRVYCHPLNFPSVPNVLYRNDGKGVFADVSAEAGVSAHAGNGLGIAVGDYDDDGWPDVFVANDAVPNFLFHNDGRGRFTEVGLATGVAVARDGRPRAGMGTEFADYTGDGRLDLVVTNHEFETHSLFRNGGPGVFTDATVEAGLGSPTLPYVGFGVVFLDADNDADLDLAIANGHVIDNTAMFRAGSTHAQPRLLLRNTNGRRFDEVGRQAGPGFATGGVGRSFVAGDVDNDGDLDLLATHNGGPPALLLNLSPRRHAIAVRLEAVRSAPGGIGARIRVTAGGRTQTREVKSGSSYLGQNDLCAHVGLGDAIQVDRLEVRWPSGQVDRVDAPPVDHVVTVREGSGLVARTAFTGR